MEEIFSFGFVSPDGFWYNQDESEFVYIAEGFTKLELDGEIVALNKGESYFIEKHKKHRVNYTSNDCKWICVFEKDKEGQKI
ncbi:MAG: cupin domain-containing protein [Clostridia bacterium]